VVRQSGRITKITIPHFLFAFILFSCSTLSPVDKQVERSVFATPQEVSPHWMRLSEPGLDYFAGKVQRPRIEFYALRIDLGAPNLRIVAAPGGAGTTRRKRVSSFVRDNGLEASDNGVTTISTKVSSFVRDNGLLAGINVLPFDPVSGTEGEPRSNVGIVIADRVMLSPPHKSFDALVFYTDGNAAIIAQSEIKDSDNIEHAVGGFHRILENNKLVPRVLNLSERHPRSAAGISSNGKFLYLLVIDGRRLGSIGSTEAETALLLWSLGCSEGINFDGGGSSALALRYPDGKVRVVNTPIHGQIPGRERAVAGCLGIKSK
jgi:hypothetical protein